jgi:hypothetical protein
MPSTMGELNFCTALQVVGWRYPGTLRSRRNTFSAQALSSLVARKKAGGRAQYARPWDVEKGGPSNEVTR